MLPENWRVYGLDLRRMNMGLYRQKACLSFSYTGQKHKEKCLSTKFVLSEEQSWL